MALSSPLALLLLLLLLGVVLLPRRLLRVRVEEEELVLPLGLRRRLPRVPLSLGRRPCPSL